MGDNYYYDLRSQVVKLESITSSAQNAASLRGLRDFDPKLRELEIRLRHYDDDDDEQKQQRQFVIRKGDHIGWLGYFLGRSNMIQTLFIDALSREQLQVLMKGIKHNRSIQNLFIVNSVYDGAFLTHFIKHNSNLKSLRLWYLDFHHSVQNCLSQALIQRKQKSLTQLSLRHNNLSNVALTEILAALSGYDELKTLYISEELGRRDQEYYDILAERITLERITSCEQNTEILRKLRDNTWNEKEQLSVVNYDDDDDSDAAGYFFADEGNDDLGWLGYYLGKSKQVKHVNLWYQVEEDDRNHIIALIEGLSCNQSIEVLDVSGCTIDFSSLSPFVINNINLKSLSFWHFALRPICASILAVALAQRQQKSLTRLTLYGTNLNNESFGEIAASLRSYTHLELLTLGGFSQNFNGIDGSTSLGAIIRSAALHLKDLCLDAADLDDASLSVVTSALTNATTLQKLDLSSNRSITAEGFRTLASLLSSACPLETLYLNNMNIGDDGAEALAGGLMGNTSLKNLTLSQHSAGITRTGWNALSSLLCDISCVPNTYRSNHTLEHIGSDYYFISSPNGDGSKLFCSDLHFSNGIPFDVVSYLITNKNSDCHEHAARFKILRYHPDMPIENLLGYELKLLPVVVSWFAQFYLTLGYRSAADRSSKVVKMFRPKELSAVYKFIRGMPMLAVTNRAFGMKRKFDE